MRGLAQESTGLDRTLDLTSEIMSVGSAASSQLEGQTSRLRNANSTLSKIERSSVPGAEKLVSLISKHRKKNTIILALVISVCLVLTLYSIGVIDTLKRMTASTPSPASQPNEETKSSRAES